MSDNANELKQCSRCHSTILLKYFEVNRKGELFKTCNNCRNNKKQYYETSKDDIDKKQDKAAHAAIKITCICGITHRLGDKAKHERSQAHYDILNPTPGKSYKLPDGSLGYISNVQLSDDEMFELMRKGFKFVLGISETGKKSMVPKGWEPV